MKDFVVFDLIWLRFSQLGNSNVVGLPFSGAQLFSKVLTVLVFTAILTLIWHYDWYQYVKFEVRGVLARLIWCFGCSACVEIFVPRCNHLSIELKDEYRNNMRMIVIMKCLTSKIYSCIPVFSAMLAELLVVVVLVFFCLDGARKILSISWRLVVWLAHF